MKTTIDNKTIVTPPVPYNSYVIINGKKTYSIKIELGQTDLGFIQNPINMKAIIYLNNGIPVLLEYGTDYTATIIQDGLLITLTKDISNADYFIFARYTRADYNEDFSQKISNDNLKEILNDVFNQTFYILQELRKNVDETDIDISNKVDKVNINPNNIGKENETLILNINAQGQVTDSSAVPINITASQISDIQSTINNNNTVKAKADLTYVDERDSAKVNISEIGIAGGIAPIDETGKIPSEFLPTDAEFLKGEYDARNNIPALKDNDPNNKNGDYYRVIEGGTQDFGSGPITFESNDKVMYSSDLKKFFRIPASTSEVKSVNGKVGIITLDTDDLSEGRNNIFFSTGRAKSATLITELDPTEDEKAPVSKAIYEAIIKKSDLVINPTEGNILITNGQGQPLDSGNKFSNDVLLGENLDTNIPTQKAVKTYIDNKDIEINQKIDNKVDKINIAAVSFSDSDSTYNVSVNEQGQVNSIEQVEISILTRQVVDFNIGVGDLIQNKVDKIIPSNENNLVSLNIDGSLQDTNTVISNDSTFETATQFQVPTALAVKEYSIPISEKAQPNGIAPLNFEGKISANYLYSIQNTGYKGMYNAVTNEPPIVSGQGNTGDWYRINVGGPVNIDDITFLDVGDKIAFGESRKWEREPTIEKVSSVNGKTNNVELDLDDILDGTDRKLYDEDKFQKDFSDRIGLYAPINSPSFGGNPTSVTPDINDKSNRIATTAYVQNILVNEKRYGLDVNNRVIVPPNTNYIPNTNGIILIKLTTERNTAFSQVYIDNIIIAQFGHVINVPGLTTYRRWESASYPIAKNQIFNFQNSGIGIIGWTDARIFFVPFLV